MKTKLISLLITAILVLSVFPVIASETGVGIGIDITPEEFPVHIWQCEDHVLLEDCVEAGRVSDCPKTLFERLEDYAFEGEQIRTVVLVMDKNKIEEVEDVVGTLGPTQGTGNDIEVECTRLDDVWVRQHHEGRIPGSCEARILEEDLTGTEFDPLTQAFYECLFTVETPESMQGEYFYTVEAISTDSEDIVDENMFWFLNPIVALSIDGDVEFTEVRPGSVAYSSTLLVGNDAEEGSGVLLDMFVSGTDFYDPDNSGARCPDTNQLQLSNTVRSVANVGFTGPEVAPSVPHAGLDCQAGTDGLTASNNADHLCYYASNGAYNTANAPNSDREGYVPIIYGNSFSRDFYNDAEILRFGPALVGPLPGTYHPGNILSPGAEMAVTFKLGLPEPCVGNFNEGSIFFWGEAL